MAFFSRVLGYLVNEVLVAGLANSKTFQRFAVRSSEMVQDLQKKRPDADLSKYADQISDFRKTFAAELRKGMDEQFGRGQQKRS